jgi:hypothetical protein
MQIYIVNASQQISRFFLVIACFDRFALCSADPYIRNFCQVNIARRYVIPIVNSCWLLLPIHLLIYLNAISNTCVLVGSNVLDIYQNCYSIILIGIIPPSLALIFTILTFRNLKLRQKRRRVITIINQISLKKENRDNQIFLMLLIQIFVYISSTTPYTMYLIYQFITKYNGIDESPERKLIESIISSVMEALRFVHPFISFYLFLFISKIFRKEFKSMIVGIYRKSCQLLMRRHRNDVTYIINRNHH